MAYTEMQVEHDVVAAYLSSFSKLAELFIKEKLS